MIVNLEEFNMEGNISDITGGARGIGQKICKLPLDPCYKVILTNRDE